MTRQGFNQQGICDETHFCPACPQLARPSTASPTPYPCFQSMLPFWAICATSQQPIGFFCPLFMARQFTRTGFSRLRSTCPHPCAVCQPIMATNGYAPNGNLKRQRNRHQRSGSRRVMPRFNLVLCRRRMAGVSLSGRFMAHYLACAAALVCFACVRHFRTS